jgi:hypothetical protein
MQSKLKSRKGSKKSKKRSKKPKKISQNPKKNLRRKNQKSLLRRENP